MTTTTFTPPAIAASSPLSGLRTLLEDYGEKLERRRAELAEQASLEEQLITVNAQELELEAELEGVLNALDTPRAVLTPAQASGVEAILARLEVTRGRQQWQFSWPGHTLEKGLVDVAFFADPLCNPASKIAVGGER